MNRIVISPNRIGPYSLKETIGEGAFSVVRRAVNDDSQQYACKIVPQQRIDKKSSFKAIEREVRILSQLDHPGIARLYNIYRDATNFYLIIELCETGNLNDFIMKRKKLEERDAKIIFRQIAESLHYIHVNGFAHRDIKPDNVLVFDDLSVKLIDFGYSVFFDSENMTSTCCGSPVYAAPEVIQGIKYDAQMSDIWSLGVLLYAMIYGALPWTNISRVQLLNEIVSGEFFIPVNASQEARDLIDNLLQRDVSKRMPLNQILAHPFISDVCIPLRASHSPRNAARSNLDVLSNFFTPDTTKSSTPASYMSLKPHSSYLNGKQLLSIAKRTSYQAKRKPVLRQPTYVTHQ